MPKWTKGNSGYAGKGKGQGKSDLPTDIPARYDEAFLEEMDARSEVYKMMSQRLGALVTSLGGLDGLSYQERSLCKRAIHLERLIEKRELTLALDGTIDETGYFNAVNALSGLYSKLGLKRRTKPISLKDVLSQQSATSEATNISKGGSNGNECCDNHQRADDGISPTSEECPHGYAERKE